jgi:heme/copper-type cytochrome/quinol oxidase subunit 4
MISYLFYPQKILVENYWIIFAFMAIVTLIVYYVSDLGLKKGGDNQTFILLAAISIRLFLTLFFLLFFTQKTKVESILFIINFFSIYLLFTTFEIYCLLRNLRHQIKK